MRLPLAACLCAAIIAPAAAQNAALPDKNTAATPAPAVQAAPTGNTSPKGRSAQREESATRAPSPWPGQWLLDVFGPAGVEALKTHGYIVLQGKAGNYRLQKVFWKSLGTFAGHTKAIAQFSDAFSKLKAGKALAPDGPLPFLSLANLPPDGLMSAPLHALLEAMISYHAEWTALNGPRDDVSATAAPKPAIAGPNLYDTPWGKTLAARTRADLLAEPQALVKPYFDMFLAGVRREPGAVAHFAGYLQDRYQVDISSRLASDVLAGSASKELRGWIRRYLSDQRRLHTLDGICRQVETLEKKSALSRDLRDLEIVAGAFHDRPDLVGELEGVVQTAPPPAATPELTAAGLHLEKPVKLGQHESGDVVTISGAYWVDSLPEKAAVDVEETTWRETPQGLRDLQTQIGKRRNGGPYIFTRRLRLEDARDFTFHSVISATSGKALDDSIAVPVAVEFDLALDKLAAADNQALSCAFQEAQAAYAQIEESIADAAQEKPQYRDLLETARGRRREASLNAVQLAQVDEAAAEYDAEASSGQCHYDLKRIEAAIASARTLPAGCDRYLARLNRQRDLLSRRIADQEAFAADSNLAASHRRSCNFGLAAEAWARGLAILDANPAARCGKTAETALRAEAGLQAARTDELWRAAFADELRAAEAQTIPAKRLGTLHAVIARIGYLSNPSCFSQERDQAEKMAQAAGSDLSLPDAVAAGLAEDGELSGVVADVSAQRRKLTAEAAALQTKQGAEQAPTPAPAAQAPEDNAVPAGPVKTPAQPPKRDQQDAKTKTKNPVLDKKTEASQ